MKRVRRNKISDITNVAISELIILDLDSVAVSLNADDSTKGEIFVTELLRWIKIEFSFFGKDLNLLTNFEVVLEILNDWKIFKRSRSDSIKNANLDMFALDLDINWMNTVHLNTLNYSSGITSLSVI